MDFIILLPLWYPGMFICKGHPFKSSNTLFAIALLHYLYLKQELMETIEIFIGQLRQLFGLKPSYLSQNMDMPTKFVVSEKGFTEW